MIVKKEKELIEPYLVDASNYKGFSECVYIPENIDEVRQIVLDCYEHNTPITISGGGTGLVGARVPLGGVVISTEKLNKIRKIDKINKTVVIEPAVTQNDLEPELNSYNLFFPPNPTEKNGSIGGNVATNASGARTFKYGQIRKYVNKLIVLLANGDELYLERGQNPAKNNKIKVKSKQGKIYEFDIPELKLPNVKHNAGYYFDKNMDAIDLFIGSEGTLGIFTEIELKLLEKPDNVLGLIIFFNEDEKLFDFVDYIRKESKTNNLLDYRTLDTRSARLIEFFDTVSLKLLRNKYTEIPENAFGAIWIEQEYNPEFEEQILEAWYELLQQYTDLSDFTWVALNDKDHEKFREFRHELPLQVFEIVTKNDQIKINPDIAVPDEHFKYFYFFTVDQLKKLELNYVVFGHIGNSHYHANVFLKNEEELQKAEIFYSNCIDEALRLGGTISAEHGIGKIKKKYLYKMFGEDGINKMKEIKKIFDPKFLLGKNTLFD